MIEELRNGYRVLSRKGKNLGGPYQTREEAEKRLRQVESFKRRSSPKRITRRSHLTRGD
jgi:hypothetical protein